MYLINTRSIFYICSNQSSKIVVKQKVYHIPVHRRLHQCFLLAGLLTYLTFVAFSYRINWDNGLRSKAF